MTATSPSATEDGLGLHTSKALHGADAHANGPSDGGRYAMVGTPSTCMHGASPASRSDGEGAAVSPPQAHERFAASMSGISDVCQMGLDASDANFKRGTSSLWSRPGEQRHSSQVSFPGASCSVQKLCLLRPKQ
jgi:hypothetical protein